MTATDAASTRDAILDAAEELFARQGFAATTIKQLGTSAGVNSALLYYYFDDKEALYRATLRRIIERMAGAGASRLRPGADPRQAVRALVEFQTEFLVTHPRVPRLIMRELMEHDARHAEAAIGEIAAKLFQRLCDVIEQGQAAGIFRRDVDPRFAAVSTMGQVLYANLARPAVGILLGHGRGGLPPDELRRFGRHAADFALAALTQPDNVLEAP